MSHTKTSSSPRSREDLLLDAVLTTAAVLLHVQTELAQIRALLHRQAATGTATPSARVCRGLRWLQTGRSLWETVSWAIGTKWGQAIAGLAMPLVMSEARWGWLLHLLRRLFE